MDSSYVDLADPRHLEFDYLRWIDSVLRTLRARRVLHLGGGACALPRALASRDPEGLQEVWEIDADVLTLAREHMGLRRAPGLRVREGDGLRALEAAQTDRFDAVVIDAFVGAQVPVALTDEAAAGLCARVAPLALVNVVDDRIGREVARISRALVSSFRGVWRIGGRGGNRVLLAGDLDAQQVERIGAALARDAAPAQIVATAGA